MKALLVVLTLLMLTGVISVEAGELKRFGRITISEFALGEAYFTKEMDETLRADLAGKPISMSVYIKIHVYADNTGTLEKNKEIARARIVSVISKLGEILGSNNINIISRQAHFYVPNESEVKRFAVVEFLGEDAAPGADPAVQVLSYVNFDLTDKFSAMVESINNDPQTKTININVDSPGLGDLGTSPTTSTAPALITEIKGVESNKNMVVPVVPVSEAEKEREAVVKSVVAKKKEIMDIAYSWYRSTWFQVVILFLVGIGLVFYHIAQKRMNERYEREIEVDPDNTTTNAPWINCELVASQCFVEKKLKQSTNNSLPLLGNKEKKFKGIISVDS